MINYQKTRFTKTDSSAVESGVMISEEGLALIAKREGADLVIRPSQGAAGEVFAGFSYERTSRPDVLAMVAESVVVVNETFLMARAPIAGQLAVFIDGTKVTVDLAAEAPVDGTTVNMDGQELYFHASAAGKSLRVQMRYTPSLEEARTYGEGNEFGDTPASYEVGVCGRVVGGTLSTTAWDPAADWADESKLHPVLGADGLLTIGGSGTELKNLIIKTAPSQGNPYITVEFIL